MTKYHRKLVVRTLLIFMGTLMGFGIHVLTIIAAPPVPIQVPSLVNNVRKLQGPNSTGDASEYPRIVHQIWLDYMTIPEAWADARRHNMKLNHGVKHILWTSRDIEVFLEREYPWFLDTYHGYGYFSQKVDSARYFIVYHYGGAYMDMDFIVNVSLSEIYHRHRINDYECAFAQTWPSGLSNALFSCKRHSQFLWFMISNLKISDRWVILPYARTMCSTGPVFVTKCFNAYEHNSLIYILEVHLYTAVYFTHLHGSTWHSWDAHLIRALYNSFVNKWFIITMAIGVLFKVSMHFVHRKQKYVSKNNKTVLKKFNNNLLNRLAITNKGYIDICRSSGAVQSI